MQPGSGDEAHNFRMEEVKQKLLELGQLTPATDDFDITVKQALEGSAVLDDLHQRLIDSTLSTADKALTAQLIAEYAKSEYGREPLTKENLLKALVSTLNSSDKELSLQSSRALGNLCYDNDECRGLVLSADGLTQLEKLLTFCVEKHNSFVQLKAATCGFLHNLINGNDSCQKAVLNTKIVQSLKSLLELNASNKTIATFCLMALSSVAEVEGGRDVIYKSGVVSSLLKMFVNTNIKDTDEFLLSLLSTLTSECDDVKKLVAESSADMHVMNIISLLSSSSDEDDQALVKSASELLVLVLTGDEAMKIWFDGGNGFVFTSVCQWLGGSNGQLLQSAAFALGNFARDDENSHIIIHRGINLELCKCLDQLLAYKEDSRTAPTIHAILSALRNLAIAPTNKLQLLDQGILAHLIPYMECENTVVTSKLVGVLRLLVDKNEKYASQIGKNETVVQRLVTFGQNDHNMLLKGESTRCLAWIIKNSLDKQVLDNVIEYGGISHLVFLVNSEHVVMQNEGLIALILLLSTSPDKAVPAMRESTLLPSLKELLGKDTLPTIEVTQNSLMLINQLNKKGLADEVKNQNMEESLKRLSEKYQTEAITSLVTAINDSL